MGGGHVICKNGKCRVQLFHNENCDAITVFGQKMTKRKTASDLVPTERPPKERNTGVSKNWDLNKEQIIIGPIIMEGWMEGSGMKGLFY